MKFTVDINKKSEAGIIFLSILKKLNSHKFKKACSKLSLKVSDVENSIKLIALNLATNQNMKLIDKLLNHKQSLRKYFSENFNIKKSIKIFSKINKNKFKELLNTMLGVNNYKKKREKARFVIDCSDLRIDINIERKYVKKVLDGFFWTYSPEKLVIGLKMVLVFDVDNNSIVHFDILNENISDAKIYPKVLEKLSKTKRIKKYDMLIADKGFFSKKNYLISITKYKIIPLIFPKKSFDINKIMNISMPLTIYYNSITKIKQLKNILQNLIKKFTEIMKNWKQYKPIRSKIEDVFKIIKYTFSLKTIHKYTPSSVQKTVYLGVLLASEAINIIKNKKTTLKQLAEM